MNTEKLKTILSAARKARPCDEGTVVVKFNLLYLTNSEAVTVSEALEARGNVVVWASKCPDEWLYVTGPDAGAEYDGDPWPWPTDESVREVLVS